MVENIISLIIEGVIGTDDLLEFSENLKSAVKLMIELYQGEKLAKDNGWNNYNI